MNNSNEPQLLKSEIQNQFKKSMSKDTLTESEQKFKNILDEVKQNNQKKQKVLNTTIDYISQDLQESINQDPQLNNLNSINKKFISQLQQVEEEIDQENQEENQNTLIIQRQKQTLRQIKKQQNLYETIHKQQFIQENKQKIIHNQIQQMNQESQQNLKNAANYYKNQLNDLEQKIITKQQLQNYETENALNEYSHISQQEYQQYG